MGKVSDFEALIRRRRAGLADQFVKLFGLGRFQKFIEDVELVDYRVRVFQGGTDAVTRVLIECADKDGERWSTVGVSANVIDASFQALVDSINYKLMVSGAK